MDEAVEEEEETTKMQPKERVNGNWIYTRECVTRGEEAVGVKQTERRP